MDSTSSPAQAINHDMIQFKFHISPAPRSSRPQTGVGTSATSLSSRRARSRSSLRRLRARDRLGREPDYWRYEMSAKVLKAARAAVRLAVPGLAGRAFYLRVRRGLAVCVAGCVARRRGRDGVSALGDLLGGFGRPSEPALDLFETVAHGCEIETVLRTQRRRSEVHEHRR